MEFLNPILFVLMLFSSTIPVFSYSQFSPIDHYLLDCGSTLKSTVDNRVFISDSSPFLSSPRSSSLRNQHPFQGLPPIYSSARVFELPSKYEFQIRDRGTHMVRLHFQTFSSSNLDLIRAQFHVLVNGYVILSNFSGVYAVNPRIKEYLIWIGSETLEITFVPVKKSDFAFINAIEVISAPKDLVADTAKFLSSEHSENVGGLAEEGLEVLYRVNVGGPKVTPFNDSFWRTWVPDDEHFESNEGSKKVYSSGRIKYQAGGASREVGPDNVYNSARVIQSRSSLVPKMNMTWTFPVVDGYRYIVRLHFCDIASISIGLLFFNIYVNGFMAYENFDLSTATNWELSSPFYVDFLVNSGVDGVLRISIGHSNQSIPYGVDGMLNGIEIMKLKNPLGSFDGNLSAQMVLERCQGSNLNLVPYVVILCLLVSASVILRRRVIRKVTGRDESFPWSKVPVVES
ncbi:probable receptor-like protein kinase At5g24010 [Momordica charantia]|uniref:Probable receptor-like protein kinase At5g24010 n=1 Tax=Momordica charantia TaxID=3673 RepID=A0A6J1D1M0_MOMCH|nr:probable receptor-like protein kinase At5g24010 [Momordica charantia]